LETFRRFDNYYLKKWLVSQDAEDIMALRMQVRKTIIDSTCKSLLIFNVKKKTS